MCCRRYVNSWSEEGVVGQSIGTIDMSSNTYMYYIVLQELYQGVAEELNNAAQDPSTVITGRSRIAETPEC